MVELPIPVFLPTSSIEVITERIVFFSLTLATRLSKVATGLFGSFLIAKVTRWQTGEYRGTSFITTKIIKLSTLPYPTVLREVKIKLFNVYLLTMYASKFCEILLVRIHVRKCEKA
ncbi:X-linked retinitis pigmentosa GTPase regulator [Trichinella pseudospiralis]